MTTERASGAPAESNSTYEELFETRPSETTSEGTDDSTWLVWTYAIVLAPIFGLLVGAATHWIVTALAFVVGMFAIVKDIEYVSRSGDGWDPTDNASLYAVGMIVWIVTVPYYLYKRHRHVGL